MSTDNQADAPFQLGDVIMARIEGAEIAQSYIGEVRGLGTYPAPWVRLVTPDGDAVVFLGPGVTVQMRNDLKRR